MRTPFLSVKTQKMLVCLFFAATLALGLLTAADYGRPWDESDEMDILRMNLWEYARALGMDESGFEPWANEQRPTISALVPIGDSVERDHGISPFYPLAGVMLNRDLSEHDRVTAWRWWCWALFTLGLYALYACCRQLGFSRGMGVLAALCLLLTPRFFAEGHYNNKDIVLLSLALCALWQGLGLMRRPTFPRALLFALAGAFAANTKVVGFALWGLCALFVLVRQLARGKMTPRVWLVGGAALGAFVALYALLTPALWRAPAAFAEYLVKNALAFGRWGNYVRFRGANFLLASERLPWYYLPYMIAATTPLWLLGLTGLGTLLGAWRLWRCRRTLLASDRTLGLLLSALLWLLPLAFAVLTRTAVYNGWRHFYFLYGFMLLTAMYGLRTFACRFVQNRAGLRRAMGALLALCMLLTGAGVATQHPYQYAYYQPLVRLRASDDFLELDYWNVSVMNALEALARQTDGEITLGYADLWAKEGLGRTLPAMTDALRARITLTDDPAQAEYLLVNPTYSLFSGFSPSPDMEEAVRLSAYGRTIMRVYRSTVNSAMEDMP